MGGMFSSGNTNTIAKINKKNISTQEFIDYLNGSGIPQNTNGIIIIKTSIPANLVLAKFLKLLIITLKIN